MAQVAAEVEVIGGGLAGSEAAWQLAARGVRVSLSEMRPAQTTPIHRTADLAELVCSNSMKSTRMPAAPAILKSELELLGSFILAAARKTSLPAGTALAVDREAFARLVTHTLESEPNVVLVREERRSLSDAVPTILATGPLTSPEMERFLAGIVGRESLYFFDAAAPLVETDSIHMDKAFHASRYGRGGGDYINCPLDEKAYNAFWEAMVAGDRTIAKSFETRELFSACEPVEEVARRGRDALRYGPMKPVGLTDPATGRRPYAVVQLRRDNRAGTVYNMVGFQTNLKWSVQDEVLRMIPALGGAEFVRYGVMHRNTFVDAPRILGATLEARTRPQLRLAGQITGSEGYLEAAATGLVAALNAYAALRGIPPVVLPPTTGIGSLIRYVTTDCQGAFQPQHVNLGLLPPLAQPIKNKKARHEALAARAIAHLSGYVASRPDLEIKETNGAA